MRICRCRLSLNDGNDNDDDDDDDDDSRCLQRMIGGKQRESSQMSYGIRIQNFFNFLEHSTVKALEYF
uniref:Uncharacterized protein n=1 Tax=Syphacia muris TaxID=451379 RepID=A0A0N5APF6_9BILA